MVCSGVLSIWQQRRSRGTHVYISGKAVCFSFRDLECYIVYIMGVEDISGQPFSPAETMMRECRRKLDFEN